jgi:hypothetical protein
MWLADIARDFDPSDKDFFTIKVKPVIDKKVESGIPYRKFKPQIEGLKRFILTNYPEIISDDVKKLIDHFIHSDNLTRKELTCLQNLVSRATNPKELLRYRKFIHRTMKKNETNRVADSFLSRPIFKESFTTILS